jgi:hypothetical protein
MSDLIDIRPSDIKLAIAKNALHPQDIEIIKGFIYPKILENKGGGFYLTRKALCNWLWNNTSDYEWRQYNNKHNCVDLESIERIANYFSALGYDSFVSVSNCLHV